MSCMQRIQVPVEKELAEFQGHFKSAMRTDVALLDRIMRYIIKRKGKQMRPLFVFLSAQTVAGGEQDSGSAATSPLPDRLHTATLVHDDVVDESPCAAVSFSIQAGPVEENRGARGDYLLARLAHGGGPRSLRPAENHLRSRSPHERRGTFANRKGPPAGHHRGGLLRHHPTQNGLLDCRMLCVWSCVRAAHERGNAEEVERMRKFGELVGLAFQIKDDLLDLGEGERIGKPTGGDIRERKMTLPLIHTLQVASPSERRRLIRLVKYRNNDTAAVQEVMDAIIQGPGMEYARGKMRELAQEALGLLDAYPESAAKTALVDLVEFTMERKR